MKTRILILFILAFCFSGLNAAIVEVYTSSKVKIPGTRYTNENHTIKYYLIDEKDQLEASLNKLLGNLSNNVDYARKKLKTTALNNQELINSIARSWLVNLKFKELNINEKDLPSVVVSGRLYKNVANLDVLMRILDEDAQN